MGRVRKSLITPEGLTPKQKKFANRYLETGNGSEAIRKAGYELNGTSPSLVTAMASENLAKPSIQGYIASQLTYKDLTPQLILNKLLESVESLNPAEKLKSLELLGKHLRMFGDKLDATNQLEQVKSIGWASPCSISDCSCTCHGENRCPQNPPESTSISI